jgi:biotin carboxyl carrier protein
MRYSVTVNGQTFDVDLAQGTRVNGKPIDVQLASVPGSPVRRLSVSGRSHALHVGTAEAEGNWDIHLDGERFNVSVVDERTQTIRAMTGSAAAAQGPKPVRAPMPGLIVRIQVAEGDHVAAGQGVVIIEAMKMENELKADAPGVVRKVPVQPGQAVEKGTVLIEFQEKHG